MSSERDRIQDELIQRNAEHIRRNEAAILRQTEALEKIRDHYFPKKTVWKRILGFCLKIVGAATVSAGLMETADWYWNTRKTDRMAAHSAAVAKQILMRDSDFTGAMRFLEKAVELDDDTIQYRIALGYVKGLSTIVELYDLERPFTAEERERVDAILAEAMFLQEAAPHEAMTFVLAAQARMLRGEKELAFEQIRRAIELDPENAFIRICACSVYFSGKEMAEARRQVAEAERINSNMALILYWKGMIAGCEKDLVSARHYCDELLRRMPDTAISNLLDGLLIMEDAKPDFAAARAAFLKVLTALPKSRLAFLGISDTYEREGDLKVAKIWLDRLLAGNPLCMRGLIARARVAEKLGDRQTSIDDLTTAIALDPLRGDLYRLRAEVYEKLAEKEKAKRDRDMAVAIDHTKTDKKAKGGAQ